MGLNPSRLDYKKKETNVEKKGPGKADINTGIVPQNSLPEAGRDKVCSTRVYGESRELQIP